MDILKNYASRHAINYNDLLADFVSSPKEEQEAFLMQIGGEQEGSGDITELLSAYAQLAGIPFEELMAQFDALPDQQKQAFIDQALAAVYQANNPTGQEGQMMAQTGIPVTEQGYYELDPLEDPYAYIPTPDGSITMQGIDYPINAYDGNTGEFLDQMQPGQEYNFDTDLVLEEPIYAQTTGFVNTDNNFPRLRRRLMNTYPEYKNLASKGKLETKKDILKAIKVFPISDSLKEEIDAIDEDFLLTGNEPSNTASKISTIPAQQNTFREEFSKVKAREEEILKEYQKQTKEIKTQVKAVGTALFNSKKELTKSQLTQAYQAFKSSQKEGVPFSLNPDTKEGRSNLKKVGNALDKPALSSTGSGGMNIPSGVRMDQATNPFSAIKKAIAPVLNYIEDALERPALGAVTGATNPESTTKVKTPSPETGTKEDTTIPKTGNTTKPATPQELERYRKQYQEVVDSIPASKPKNTGKGKNPTTSTAPATATNDTLNFLPGLPTDQELQVIANDLGMKPVQKELTPEQRAAAVNIGDGTSDAEWGSRVSPTRPTVTSTTPSNTQKNNAPATLARFNVGTGFFGDLLRNSKAARAFGATAPVFRGQARFNFIEQPLIDFQPIADGVRSIFNDAIRNINSNSTSGAAMISYLQSKATDDLTKAANQVNSQNNRINAMNNQGRVQAANQLFERQQALDMAAYDQQLRRSAARDLAIDNATAEMIAAQEAANERKVMFDTLPLLHDGIEDISNPLDRLIGRRKYAQNKNYKLSYTTKNNSNA